MLYTVVEDEILFCLLQVAVAIPASQAAGKLQQSGNIPDIQQKTWQRLDRHHIFLGLVAGTELQFVIAE
jgi:hypothetical protein